MPPRSKVITMLPAYIREEIERRLFANGFRDYEGLAQWVRGQGYEISDDSLWRYGYRLQQQLAAMRLTVGLARTLGELAEDHQLLMARALMPIAQQKAPASLAEKEEVTPGDLNAIANLTRAAIAQQRWAAELKAQGEQQHQATVDRKCEMLDQTRPSRNAPPAIAPLDQGHAASLTASEETVALGDRPRETSRDDERLRTVDQRASETDMAIDSSSIAGRDGALTASIQPAIFRGPPRIAAALRAEERAMLVANPGLLRTSSSPCVGRGSTQIAADLRT